jgi:hypothetical protein
MQFLLGLALSVCMLSAQAQDLQFKGMGLLLHDACLAPD